MPSLHPDISDRLMAYLDGQLEEPLRGEVREHLESCASCLEEMGPLREIIAALRSAAQNSPGEKVATDRYGCPNGEELTLREAESDGHPSDDGNWIAHHLQTCPRCQLEVDLIRLMRAELQEATGSTTPQDLSARVEARLIARVRQEEGIPDQGRFLTRLSSFSPRFLMQAALGLALAATAVVWVMGRIDRGPVIVAQRPSGREVREVQPPPPPPSPPLAAPVSRVVSPRPKLATDAPAAQSVEPRLPPLVPAKLGESLRALILPTPTHPGLRSALAAGLQDYLGTVEPPEREFPAHQSVDDLSANRHLGRLFGVRYVVEVAVKETPPGYLVTVRAADTETGGVVAKAEGRAAEKGALEPIAGLLASELKEQLRAQP